MKEKEVINAAVELIKSLNEEEIESVAFNKNNYSDGSTSFTLEVSLLPIFKGVSSERGLKNDS